MNVNFKTSFSDRVISYALVISCAVILVQFGFLVFQFANFPPVVPLFNSLSWGQDRLAAKLVVFLVPSILLMLVFLNFFLASKFYKKNALLSRMLMFNVLMSVLLSTFAIVQIFFLII